jgi:hypothetical protein
VRFTPLIGTKAWFGPRRYGWPPGWEPVTWEGWVAMLAFVVVIVLAALLDGVVRPAAMVLSVVASLLVVCILKGTSAGGPEAGDRFAEIRRYAKRTPEDQETDRLRRQLTPDEPSVTAAARRLRTVPKRRRRR